MRIYKLFFFPILLVGLVVFPQQVGAATTGERLAGRILLDVPRVGDVWYVHPKTQERYYLGGDVDAYSAIVSMAVRISGKDIARIPTTVERFRGSPKLRQRLSGYFLLDMSDRGRLWYVSPRTQKRRVLEHGASVQTLLQRSGYQTSQAELRQIAVAANSLTGPAIPVKVTTAKTIRVASSRGTFTTNQLILDRRNKHWQIMTDTGDAADCSADCSTLSVRDFARRRNAVAGFQGTYFCDDGVNCLGGLKSYIFPVFNSWSRTMMNQGQVKYSVDPMVVFDTNNRPIYLSIGSQFGTLAEFEARNGLTVQAALSNAPAMVEAGQNVLQNSVLDSSQRNTKATRTFLGWKGYFVYFVAVRSATLPDAAAVATSMGLEYVINLDGGGSTALYNDGRHYAGPGRTVPNALLILQR